ncbi:T9SS type A sorting domain-containing protein [Bizionia myxarmorum]|uniref:T9SS type A sorting domain-containing protein n=1 Tax=Bizionia myxarmorum TaxID=291186 RepID=A0A5D0R6A9_9FLAO|nr:T9SS type A sorting domain-containing protein [Bizionia myxarmorum]TYB77180.1 T9SS type A sorting domain-containing protein [Bizionia myxarmorum]
MKKNYILLFIFALGFLQINAQTPCSQSNPAPVTSIIYTNPERSNATVAFDMVVAPETQFSLTTVTVKMAAALMANLNPTGTVSIYNNASNLPGTLVVSEVITPTVVTEAPISTFAIYTVTFTFSTPVVLNNLIGTTPATYWVGFQMGNVNGGDTGVTGGDVIAGLPYAAKGAGAWTLGALDGTYTFEGICLLSVDDFSLKSISVTPNPAQDYINIDFPNSISNYTTELFDIAGKLVLKSNNVERLNVSKLHSGIYILKISTDTGSVSKRIIKS